MNGSNLGGIGALFPRFGTFKSDVIDYGIAGASSFGGLAIWARVEPQINSLLPASLPAWVRPAIKVAAGAIIAPVLGRKGGRMKWVGIGVGVGLVGSGLLQILDVVSPGTTAKVSGLGYDPMLMAGMSGANLQIESPSRFVPSPSSFQGAQLSVERPSKFGGLGGVNAGVASVFAN